jgi:GTP-binding protein
LLAFEEGVANAFGITGAQERGLLFIEPKDEVFKDMIIGVHQRPGDLPVNVCKTKAVSLAALPSFPPLTSYAM